MTTAGTWSVSKDGERYYGNFASREEAIAGAAAWVKDAGQFFVGQCTDPTPPEDLFSGDAIESWIDNEVLCHDEYSGEWAEDAMRTTGKQREELAAEIRPIIAAWLDRHKLRPTFWNIDPMTVEEVQA